MPVKVTAPGSTELVMPLRVAWRVLALVAVTAFLGGLAFGVHWTVSTTPAPAAPVTSVPTVSTPVDTRDHAIR
ncbi:hypothetical protein GCM10010174_03750 [Kutzneria viridogrisea]|uniref:Uncharacterized protein n=1 Tax=Kutzneria viridogrisea TaxID=47990 RepID=A0ABR6BS55_9PSEU|nr:hypothetical protein [Kutzneria viridogrisea]